MSNSGGVISAPVNVQSDVYSVLGISAQNGYYDLAYACANGHGKTNKWSKNKPVRYNKVADLTDSEKRAVNYGLDVAAAYSLDIGSLFDLASAGTGWEYLAPRAGTDYSRLDDFVGYNHKSQTMFVYTALPSSIPTIGTTADTDLLFKYNASAGLKPSDFGWFDSNGGASTFHYAVAYYKTKGDIRFAHGSVISTTGDIIIPVKFPSLGTWTCLFIATKETGETTEVLPSVYMPGGLFSVRVYQVTRYAYVTITNDFSSMWMDEYGIYGFYMPSISVVDDGNSFPSTSGRLALEVYCYNSSGYQLDFFEVDDYNNAEFTYAGTGTKTYTLDFLAGGSIQFSEFAPSLDAGQVSYVTVYAKVVKTSGNGLFSMKGTYSWTVRK